MLHTKIIPISRMSTAKYNITFQVMNITTLETLRFINSLFFPSFIHLFTPSFLTSFISFFFLPSLSCSYQLKPGTTVQEFSII